MVSRIISETKVSVTNDIIETYTKWKSQTYEIIVRNPVSDSTNLFLDMVSTNDIYNKIADILSKSGVVDKIFIIREENTFCIWTVLNRGDKDARQYVYASELEIIRYFSSIEFHFDFHLADPEDLEELVDSGIKLIYPKI